jgi:hypothetical protein
VPSGFLPIHPTTTIAAPIPIATPLTVPTVRISAAGSFDFAAIDRKKRKALQEVVWVI